MHLKGELVQLSGAEFEADHYPSCLTSGEYSDLTIKCGDDVYNVHKIIVCTRAGFFARAIKFGGRVCTAY
jgi:hypothetical protein